MIKYYSCLTIIWFILFIFIFPMSAYGITETIQDINLGYLDEVRTIDSNEYLVYGFSGVENDIIKVDIEVTNGDPIDTFFMDSEEFSDYRSMMLGGSQKGFKSFMPGIGENIKYKSYTHTFYQSDKYYIVIDNSGQPKGGARPSGSVNVKIKIIKDYETMNKIAEEKRKAEEERKNITNEIEDRQKKINEALHPKGIIQEIDLGTLEETKTIKPNEYLAYSFLGKEGQILNVSIDVIKGDAIDVSLLDSSNFMKLQSTIRGENPESWREWTIGDSIKSKVYTFQFSKTDKYFIIVDNTIQPKSGADPTGPVDVKIKIIKKPIFTPSTPGFESIYMIFLLTLISFIKREFMN